jgi:hypothetical protein
MSAARSARVLVAAAAIALAPAHAYADEIGPAMPTSPAAIAPEPASAAPITVRHGDADAIFRNARPHAEAPMTPASGDGTRVFSADEPPRPVVNPTSRFLFDDATDRPAHPVKSLAERKAAVEAVRRSVSGGSR